MDNNKTSAGMMIGMIAVGVIATTLFFNARDTSRTQAVNPANQDDLAAVTAAMPSTLMNNQVIQQAVGEPFTRLWSSNDGNTTLVQLANSNSTVICSNIGIMAAVQDLGKGVHMEPFPGNVCSCSAVCYNKDGSTYTCSVDSAISCDAARTALEARGGMAIICNAASSAKTTNQ